jgi:anaerobic dimethyl sulfoxide reductase subunit A
LALGSSGSTGALHDTENLLARFLNSARSDPGFTAASNPDDWGPATFLQGSYSHGAARFVLPYLYGEAAKRSGWDASNVFQSRLLVLWGANVLEARLGAELAHSVSEAAKAGLSIIVIDPRRSKTVKALGARWIPIRPGTDPAMMLAVLHVLFSENLVEMERAEALAVGLEELRAYVLGHTDGLARSPSWAEGLCGVPASTIAEFARTYAGAKPAMLLPGYSIQRVRSGEEAFRLTAALQIATGNFGVPGPGLKAIPSLARGDEPSVPILRWPDAVLEGRDGGYPSSPKVAYVAGCNFVNQGADVHKNLRAMHALEFSVCHELFLTPTARLCDVVLPAASPLEKADACVPWDGNSVLYKPQVVEIEGQARSDFDIFAELADLMGFGGRFHEGLSASAWLEGILAGSRIPDLENLKSTGVYHAPDRGRVGLSDFAADPVGHPLPTPSGKVELFSRHYSLDTGGSDLPIWDAPPTDPEHPFLLVTPKTQRRTHSQNAGGIPWAGGLPSRKDLGELTMHSRDAAALGVTAGHCVMVSNARGRVVARAVISEDIMEGVVCLHEGAWFELDTDGLDRAGCSNLLCSTDGSGPAKAAVMNGVRVKIAVGPETLSSS